ncbi:unnamed protein product [Rhizoctonia solani]|uniref:Uncharacterized protein n=1 Tax=Rhizoctonia solani TaxID=456999 RepID=A0A8H3CMM9_9AGAM|nr:unnamed protein product [Rhizoctonia solani]
MHVLSFGRRPTIPGPAPGSSYYVANASVKGMRVALGLADPVRVQFGAFGVADGLLSDWCELHSQASVQAMQLRKERKGPFFHEYIAFSMKNSQGGTTYFRLDRRQLPNEGCPLDCTEDAGVEPYETIEQITDFEDSMYSPSDCLVRLDFKDGLRLQLIIDICREISQHDLAGVYTVQRYNCYFYAQTVLLLALCKEYDWYEDSIWEYHISASDESYYSPIALPPAGFDIHWKSPLRMIRPKRNSSGSGIMREIDIGYLQQYLSDMIYSHSVRVGQYALLLKCTAQGVDTDIKKAMDEIWANRWLILGQVEEVDPILSTKRRRRQQRRETYEWDGFGDGHDLSHRQQAGARKRGTVG